MGDAAADGYRDPLIEMPLVPREFRLQLKYSTAILADFLGDIQGGAGGRGPGLG